MIPFILGAYSPLLEDGNILVDDVLASCHAFVDHNLAHLAMTPMQGYPEMMDWIFGVNAHFPGLVSIASELST